MEQQAFPYLFDYLKTRYKNVCYLGDKICVDILDKKKYKTYNSISFYVETTKEDLLNIFTHCEVFDNYILLDWAFKKYKIYFVKGVFEDTYKATCFMPVINRGGLMDIHYNPFNITVSCVSDIYNNIIRFIGNDYDSLIQQDPNIIIKLFELKSLNNFAIEPYTLMYMNKYKHNITDFNSFYNIFTNQYALETLDFIKQIEFFKDTSFEEIFNKLYNYKIIIQRAHKYKLSFMEQYFIIFRDNLYDNDIYKYYLSNYDKYCVKWCDLNYNILTENKTQLRLNIYNSMDNAIRYQGIQLLKNCLIRLNNIHILQKDGAISKDTLLYCLCGRPYFEKQLCITDEEIKEIFPGVELHFIKDKIIRFILCLDKYPDNLKETIKQHKEEVL